MACFAIRARLCACACGRGKRIASISSKKASTVSPSLTSTGFPSSITFNGQFSQPTNPATEWYLKYDATTPITALQITDMVEVSKLVLGITSIKSIHYHRYDVNYDGRINVADENYINLRRYGFFGGWINMSPSRLFTSAQYTT